MTDEHSPHSTPWFTDDPARTAYSGTIWNEHGVAEAHWSDTPGCGSSVAELGPSPSALHLSTRYPRAVLAEYAPPATDRPPLRFVAADVSFTAATPRSATIFAPPTEEAATELRVDAVRAALGVPDDAPVRVGVRWEGGPWKVRLLDDDGEPAGEWRAVWPATEPRQYWKGRP